MSTATRMRARRAAAVRWGHPDAHELGRVMAWRRLLTAAWQMRKFGRVSRPEQMQLWRILDGTAFPGDEV